MNQENTFGDYEFEEWVPKHVREIITDFWGQFGRTYQDWLESPSRQGVREVCYHGPGPNGFGMPPNGAMIDAHLTNFIDKPDWYRGRYIHCWNNIGRLIDEEGNAHFISTGDRWVRVWQSAEEHEIAMA